VYNSVYHGGYASQVYNSVYNGGYASQVCKGCTTVGMPLRCVGRVYNGGYASQVCERDPVDKTVRCG